MNRTLITLLAFMSIAFGAFAQVSFDNVRLGFEPKGGVLSTGILGQDAVAGDLVRVREGFFVAMAHPVAALTTQGYGCAVSNDKQFIFSGSTNLDSAVYKKIGNQYKRVGLIGLLTGTGFDGAFSADGQLLIVAGSSVEKAQSFKWDANLNSFVKTAAIYGNIPSNASYNCGLSADGTRLVLGNAYDTTPGVRRFFSYTWSEANNRFEETAAPDIEPDDRTYGLDISGDGNFAAVGDLTGTRITTYKWSAVNNRFEKTANPNSDTAATIYDIELSYDGAFMAVGSSLATARLRTYKWVAGNNRYEALANPDNPVNPVYGVGISDDGSTICAAGGSTGSGFTVDGYVWSSGSNKYLSKTKVENTAPYNCTYLGNARGLGMTADGKMFAVAHEPAASGASEKASNVILFSTDTPNMSYQIVKFTNPLGATANFGLDNVFFGYLKRGGYRGTVQPVSCVWWRTRGASALD